MGKNGTDGSVRGVGLVDEDVFGEQGITGTATQGRLGKSVSPLPPLPDSLFRIPDHHFDLAKNLS